MAGKLHDQVIDQTARLVHFRAGSLSAFRETALTPIGFLMQRAPVTLLFTLLSACYLSRPAFVEPTWGDAPPPLPIEIAEITQYHRTCTDRCREERILLRRDGLASRSYRTRDREDSLFVAQIDSASFVSLAAQLIENGFFSAVEEDDDYPPLANEGFLLTAATLCRRKSRSVAGLQLVRGRLGGARAAVDSVVEHLAWEPCCRM